MAQPRGDAVLSKPLPHNLDAERSVLGAALLDKKALDDVGELKPGDFFLDQHRRMYERILELHERQEAVDTLTLTDELRKHNELEAAGGVAYISTLIDGVPRVSNVGQYAKIVREKAALRNVIHVGHSIMQKALEGEGAAEDIIGNASDLCSMLAIEVATEHGLTSYKAASIQLLRELSVTDSTKGVRVFSGVQELDKLTGGGRPGELWLITALTGAGKTLFGSQVRDRACGDGWHGLYCSGEMFAPHLVSRELATKAGVEHWKLRRPERITQDEYTSLTQAAELQCEKCHILDGELSLRRIRREARRMKRAHGLDLLVLDYDELIEAPGKDDLAQQKNLAYGAKAMAIEFKCPVFMISQLRKALDKEEAKHPTLDRIYGSGAKVKHASFVLFIHREYVRELKGDETQAQIFVLKSRDTRAGRLDALFNVKTLRWEDKPDGWEPPKKTTKPKKGDNEGEETVLPFNERGEA